MGKILKQNYGIFKNNLRLVFVFGLQNTSSAKKCMFNIRDNVNKEAIQLKRNCHLVFCSVCDIEPQDLL